MGGRGSFFSNFSLYKELTERINEEYSAWYETIPGTSEIAYIAVALHYPGIEGIEEVRDVITTALDMAQKKSLEAVIYGPEYRHGLKVIYVDLRELSQSSEPSI